ncbi:MAG: HD domain-containing protein [Candidatus Omnitrophica bacterium]|nr:HD domain-containing protein [Candidatus Omnitrophota bacterium]
MPEHAAARVLLIIDDPATAKFIREKLILSGGYSVYAESSSHRGVDTFKHNGFDVVIAKFNMPDTAGPDLIRELKSTDPDCIIISFLDEPNPTLVKDVLRLGVYDIIVKPINLDKLQFLVRKGVDLHSMTIAHRRLMQSFQENNVFLQKQNTLLAKRIEESTRNLTKLYEDLRQTYMRTIKVLAQAIDARDHYTHKHSENVAKYAVAIAEQMGLASSDVELLRDACELHDLGKIGVEDSVLLKPSSLTEEEWGQIKKHPMTGAQILEPLTFLDGIIDLVKQHHERFDGTGYPEGKTGENILLGARILHVADSFEAMTSARSYRKIPLSKKDAIAEIKKNSGKQFDPKVVDAFLKVVDKL